MAPRTASDRHRAALVERLRVAGCVAAEEEADELLDAWHGDVLESMIARREAGEPLAWVVGAVTFAGLRLIVDRGVYVPRWETTVLALRAVELLPADGVAVDLCTGSGAVAAVLAHHRPGATVVGTDVDAASCRCARRNGVEALEGDLDGPLPPALAGACDVVTAVVPYVPSGELAFLARDARDHEPRRCLDGGPDGTEVLRRAVGAAGRLLRPGGTVLLELGGDEDRVVVPLLATSGFGPVTCHLDGDGDLRALEATRC